MAPASAGFPVTVRPADNATVTTAATSTNGMAIATVASGLRITPALRPSANHWDTPYRLADRRFIDTQPTCPPLRAPARLRTTAPRLATVDPSVRQTMRKRDISRFAGIHLGGFGGGRRGSRLGLTRGSAICLTRRRDSCPPCWLRAGARRHQ